MNISETLNQLAIVIYFLASYPLLMVVMCRVGHIYIYVYIRSTYVIFDRQITKYTVIYGAIYTVLANPTNTSWQTVMLKQQHCQRAQADCPLATDNKCIGALRLPGYGMQ